MRPNARGGPRSTLQRKEPMTSMTPPEPDQRAEAGAASDGYWEGISGRDGSPAANHHPSRAMGVAYWRSPEQVSPG